VSRIRLVLVDDHPIVLAGLGEVLRLQRDLDVVATCRDGAEGIATIRAERPDVAVLDVQMPGTGGLAIARLLQAEQHPTRVVLLTGVLDDDQAVEAIRTEVPGIVLKDMPVEQLVECIRAVAAGRTWHAPEPVRRALKKLAAPEAPPAGGLTARELEIVRHVAAGLRNKDVAAALGISEGTVKIHLHRAYEKLGVDGRVELVLWLQEHGLA
jgi:DNA-binding NarL/FixJ family response regulator